MGWLFAATAVYTAITTEKGFTSMFNKKNIHHFLIGAKVKSSIVNKGLELDERKNRLMTRKWQLILTHIF